MTTGSDGMPGTPAPLITPMAIQQKEFRVSRLGGYKMQDVDAYLDELTEAVASMQAEIQRLRSASAPVAGSPDLSEMSRQADEIIARAREEAARITAAASAAAVATSGSGGGALRPFLDQERSFLRQLAELVQTHAGTVKEMARSARSVEERDDVAIEDEDVATAEPDAQTTTEPDARATSAPADVEPQEPPPSSRASDQTIRLEEPAGAQDEGSLRELFWGSDGEEAVTPSEG
jgi:DivIVA domain-containing protein